MQKKAFSFAVGALRRLALVGEVCGQTRNVRFTPKSGHVQRN